MKQFIIFILLIFACQHIACQGEKFFNTEKLGTFIGFPPGSRTTNLIDPEWLARAAEAGAEIGVYNGIRGSAFYNENWDTGYILFADNTIAKNASIRFNIYTNEIWFISNNHALILDTKIPAVQFGISIQKEDSIFTVFRNGYPSIDNNSSAAYYKVLATGKITLLKHYNKSIMDGKTSAGVPEKFFIITESLYLYKESGKKIIPVKKNKNALLQALPEYAEQIELISLKRNLKLKTEDDCIILINELNSRIQ